MNADDSVRYPGPRDTLVRYSANERTNHWIVVLAFLLAALSGLALFHPALFWLSALFGGGTWTRILHPIVGLIMAAVFAFFAAPLWNDNRLEQRDWKWLRRMQDVIHNRDAALPEIGRYNTGQKLLFFVIVVCMLGLLLSGIVIWRRYFSMYFPLGVIRLASLVHALCALVLVCAILVHVYAAIWIKGSMRAMTQGTVTAGWAWKHHRAWFRETIHAASPRSRKN